MKLVTYADSSGARLGAMTQHGVLDLQLAAARRNGNLPATMQGLIEAGPPAWDLARAALEACPIDCLIADARLLAPLPRPVRIRDCCLFLEHLEVAYKKAGLSFTEEFRRQIIYYNADNLHIFGPGADVPWPSGSQQRDYELEWACIVGVGGTNIAASRATGHIFGYTIFNDWSARDLQMPFMQGHLGPAGGKDFANSLGPWIVTCDEIADPYSLDMQARVNDQLWSSGSTNTMFHSFEDALARLSVDRPLFAGEVIGSGTVVGGCAYETGRELALGDIVALEIEGLGVLRNRVVSARMGTRRARSTSSKEGS